MTFVLFLLYAAIGGGVGYVCKFGYGLVAGTYSPDDGRSLGLQGMINDLLERCDFEPGRKGLDAEAERVPGRDPQAIGRLVTFAENHSDEAAALRLEADRG